MGSTKSRRTRPGTGTKRGRHAVSQGRAKHVSKSKRSPLHGQAGPGLLRDERLEPETPEVTEAPAGKGAETLAPQIEAFCIEYLANGYNGSAAYKASHPDCKSDQAARAGGSRLLTNSNVKAYLSARLEDAWKAKQIGGEQALALVANDATVDPRLLYGEDGKPLSPADWPDSIADAVEGLEIKPDGTVKVKFTSKGQARRTILEIAGKVKGTGDGLDAIAAAMREDAARYGQGAK